MTANTITAHTMIATRLPRPRSVLFNISPSARSLSINSNRASTVPMLTRLCFPPALEHVHHHSRISNFCLIMFFTMTFTYDLMNFWSVPLISVSDEADQMSLSLPASYMLVSMTAYFVSST